MRRGRFTHPKLKKLEGGMYVYDGKFNITCYGYDRVQGHIVWNVSKNFVNILEGETLGDAVHKLERRIKEGMVK